jgi:hypothetical protein
MLTNLESLNSIIAAAPKEKRVPSAYNTFIQTEVAKVKQANPDLKPADAFKLAAANVII